MDITCNKCDSKFKVSDDKIPAGKTASLLCPKCKSKITINPDDQAESKKDNIPPAKKDVEDSDDSVFDFAEEEGKTALVCESDSGVRKKVADVLKSADYHITTVKSNREAIKKLRYNQYDLIALNESFDTRDPDANGLLIYFSRMEMDLRRNIFVVLLTTRFRTMDHMMTYHKSVNLVVDLKNVDDFEKILNHGLTDNEMFYRVFKDSLKNTGRV